MAPRLNRIYTRTGDRGTTRLVGGDTVSKGSLLVESYGCLDELCSHVGLIRSLAAQIPVLAATSEALFAHVQNTLFDIGSLLATAPDHDRFAKRLAALSHETEAGPVELLFLEHQIDAWNLELPDLTTFVLPGGSVLNAHAHIARTVCRRLERILVRRHVEDPVPDFIMMYINRLSDLLFVYARWAAAQCGDREYPWEPIQ